MSEDHEALRREIERTETLATEYREQGLHLVGPLERQVRVLLERLRKHLDWEESAGPAIGALGHDPLRHRQQCELLESLLDDLGFDTRPPAMIAAHVAAVAGLLRRDFAVDEERRRTAAGFCTTPER